MEYTPRFSAETNSADSPEKKAAPDRRESPLRVPGLARIESGEEGGQQRAQGFHEAIQQSERQAEQTTEKKKKRKKKKSKTTASKPEESVDNQPKPEAGKVLDTVVAEASAKAQEKRSKEAAAERPDLEMDAGRKETGAAEGDESYERLPNQELPPHAISGGEVIIDLAALRNEHGQTPEYELPLRAEDIHPAAEVLPEAEAASPVVSETENSQPIAASEIIHSAVPAPTKAPEPVPAAAGGGEPPYIPPENHKSSGPEFPEPERRAAMYPHIPPEMRYAAPIAAAEDSGATALYASAMPPLAPRAVMAPAEQLVTRRELHSAVTDAERAGAGRGLLTGLLVGGAYEHFKHKRQEKREEKKHQQVTKKLEQARADYQFAAAEQTRKQDITEHQLRTAERRLAESQQTGFGIPPRPEAIARAQAAAAEDARSAVPAAERLSGSRRPEQTPLPQAQSKPAVEKPPIIDVEQGIEVPADQRLIREGAFIAQVEKATGKVVENPSFAYGHEYHRERAQESTPHVQRTAATGEVVLVAAAMDQSGQGQRQRANAGGGGATGGGTLPTPAIPSATTQGPPPPHTAPKTAGSPSGDLRADQPLWPWVVALIVIVICLVALLR